MFTLSKNIWKKERYLIYTRQLFESVWPSNQILMVCAELTRDIDLLGNSSFLSEKIEFILSFDFYYQIFLNLK